MRRYRNRDAIFESPTLFDAIALGVALIVLAVLAFVPGAEGTGRTHPAATSSPAPAPERAAVSRVLHYWTPARMRSARPLDLSLDRSGQASLHLGRPAPAASA